jgi:hypothetical protein
MVSLVMSRTGKQKLLVIFLGMMHIITGDRSFGAGDVGECSWDAG